MQSNLKTSNMTDYTIGLSILSRGTDVKLASAEARRVLSILEGRVIGENDIARESLGRPFFPGRDADFNISHSGRLIAVSMVRGKKLRVGCDVERIRPRMGAEGIAQDFFSVPEKNYLFHQGRFSEMRFYQIWTLKECFLKLRGFSIFDMKSTPSFVNDERLDFDEIVSSQLAFRLYEVSGGNGERYILATAIEGAIEPKPEIRWFSQSFLDCKMIVEIKAVPNPAKTVSPKR